MVLPYLLAVSDPDLIKAIIMFIWKIFVDFTI
jgi:hypothetical protein